MNPARHPLMLDGQPLTEICLLSATQVPLPLAAEELARYLSAALGTSFPIREGRPATGSLVLATAELLGTAAPAWSHGGHDRSRLFSSGGACYLMGENPRATLYAVYDFLRLCLGVQFFGPGPEHEHVPTLEALELAALLPRETSSAFEWRDYFARSIEAVDFTFKNRINGYVTPGEQEEYGPIHAAIHARGGLMRGPGHLWRRFLPEAELFDTQPELFPLIEGQRTITGQGACFSNPRVIEIFMEKLRTYIKAHPFWDVFALWAEDAYYPHYCGCEACAAKTAGEWYMTLVNGIARVVDEELPSHLFEFAAYHETRWPPHGVAELYKQGETMLADLSLGYTRDLFSPWASEQGGSAEVMRMYEAWRDYLRARDYRGRLLLVDYYNWCEVPNMSPAGRCLLWPLEVMQEDVRFYRAQGIQAVSDWVCFDRLCWPTPYRLWAWLALWRDPDLELARLREEFHATYFGPAAPAVLRYMDRLEALMEGPFAAESLVALDALTPLLDEARQACAGDALLARRVELLAVHLRFARLHVELWLAFQAGDEAAWQRLEKPYRDFLGVEHRATLSGAIDVPGNWPHMWFDSYAKDGAAGVARLLADGAPRGQRLAGIQG